LGSAIDRTDTRSDAAIGATGILLICASSKALIVASAAMQLQVM
jgi:hypothetical protein